MNARNTPGRRRALLYTRVSSEEQGRKGYSLPDQLAVARAYCRRLGHTVAATFTDDDSAKTRAELGQSFDSRPGWRSLEAWVRANPGAADLLLVKDWSRFARDVTDALVCVRRFERLGIEVNAIEQPVDHDAPESIIMLSVYLSVPEADNRRRALNIKRGIRQGQRAGRYLNHPPKGYRKAYDERGRFTIEPSEDAPFVREAFRLAADTDVPINEIARRLQQAGFDVMRSQLHAILRNPLFCGRIVIPAWRGEPEETVPGVHEPLVPEPLFERVQARRYGAGAPSTFTRRDLRPELPLRGHLLCPPDHPHAGARLTGSGPRSRAGHRVFYYHTQGAGAYRVRADEANEAFRAYLDASVRLHPVVAEVWEEIVARAEREGVERARRERRRLQEQKAAAEARLIEVEEKALDGVIEPDTRALLLAKYRGERAEAQAALEALERRSEAVERHVAFVAGLLTRIGSAWEAAPLEGKDAIVGALWPDGLVYQDSSYRTTPESPVIALICAQSPLLSGDGAATGSPVLSGRARAC